MSRLQSCRDDRFLLWFVYCYTFLLTSDLPHLSCFFFFLLRQPTSNVIGAYPLFEDVFRVQVRNSGSFWFHTVFIRFIINCKVCFGSCWPRFFLLYPTISRCDVVRMCFKVLENSLWNPPFILWIQPAISEFSYQIPLKRRKIFPLHETS